MSKTHWKTVFNSDYLSSSDIDDKDLHLTITHVRVEECKTQSGKQLCNVAHFKEQGVKPMILNVGNSKIVKKFSGNKTHLEDWVNIPITVYVDSNVRFGKETVEGLRIRPTQVKPPKQLTLLTKDKLQDAVKFIKGGKTINQLKSFYSLSPEIETELVNLLADEA